MAGLLTNMHQVPARPFEETVIQNLSPDEESDVMRRTAEMNFDSAMKMTTLTKRKAAQLPSSHFSSTPHTIETARKRARIS